MAGNKAYIYLLFVFLLSGVSIYAQKDSVIQRIILIGDAGEQKNGVHPEIEMIKKNFKLDKKTTVLYLGDNVYPQGLPPITANNYAEKKQILDSQINIAAGTEAKVYFIAGNHDWMQGRQNGYRQVLNQYRYITGLQNPNVKYVPSDVCPGPEEIIISDKITLVVIDSQWWLHKFDKPGIRSGCDANTEAELLSVLQEIVDRNEDKLLLFAAHHPFITFGRHGGYYNLKQHIFPFTELNPKLYIPLPVLGSIYPIARGVFGNIQDTKHPIYKNFSRAVDSILNRHPYCIRVAGHEHNLQFIEQNDHYYIVSGAGSKESEITSDDDLLFSSIKTGFAMIDMVNNGNIYVKFYSSENDTVNKPLYVKAMGPLDSSHVKNRKYKIPILPDSAAVVPAKYYHARRFKKWLLGNNYRDEWTTPVKVKVLDIGKEKGGLKIIKKGGGQQTKSLIVEDKNGHEYVLRTVEKFPDATLPEEFRQTIIKDAVVDGISASYPYATLSIPTLSKASKVPYATPQLMLIPDDPRLGYYQEEFANKLVIFEEREPYRYGENKSTEKIIEKLKDDNDDKVDQRAVLKARLLDMFIMDFDRHEDQWRWNTKDTGRGKLYYPLPRDRDQAFFVNEGFLTKKIAKPWRLPKLQGFRASAKDITTFNYNARFFDRMFLNSMNEKNWKNEADTLIAEMSDSVIETALQQQPPEIFKFSGNKIISTLKERRNYLKNEALLYYKFLAKEVEIPGSDKDEYFNVVKNGDKTIDVSVYKLNEERDTTTKLYFRKFYPNETKEIRLFGFAGKDSFSLPALNRRDIKLRVVDTETSGKIYKRNTFRYNILQPSPSFAYNRDDGLLLGATLSYTEHGFNKDPYKVFHQLKAHYAFLTNAFRFQYDFVAIDAIGSSDLVIHADLKAPNNTINFFGAGNNTVNNIKNGTIYKYYQTTVFNADLGILLRRKIAPDINLYYGPSFQFYNLDSVKNQNRLVADPELIGMDTTNLYHRRTYGGLATALVIDNRNDPNLPSRGIKWKTAFIYNKGLNKYTSEFSQFSSDLSVYISSNIPPKMVIALRFGGGINFGSYQFYQSQFLSGSTNLRGFRKFRFGGEKMFYNNLDVRIRLKDYQGYLFTGSYGIVLFHDIGRVWLDTEKSGRWHSGYGIGAWVAPARRFVLTGNLAHSSEGFLPSVSFGFQF